MNKKNIIDFLNSDQTYEQVYSMIENKLGCDGDNLNDNPITDFIAGGSVSNTIFYLLNKNKFSGYESLINDIDLFRFNHKKQSIQSSFSGFYDIKSPDNQWVRNTINESINVDRYGNMWVGSVGDGFIMSSSTRLGLINLIDIEVYLLKGEFNETNYYIELLKNFDLNCCMSGLDRVNKKIIYTDDFVDFLVDKKIYVLDLHSPMQTTVRLKNKKELLKSELTDLDSEILLLQHSFIFYKTNHIGDMWFKKSVENADFLSKYFTFTKKEVVNGVNLFKYGSTDFYVNPYVYHFFKTHDGNRTNQLLNIWNIFVRGRYPLLSDYYKNNISLEEEEIVSNGAFEELLKLLPGFIECDQTITRLLGVYKNFSSEGANNDEINYINQFIGKYLESNYSVAYDLRFFSCENIKDTYTLLKHIEKVFINKYGVVDRDLIKKLYSNRDVNLSHLNTVKQRIFNIDKLVKNIFFRKKHSFKHKFIKLQIN